MLQPSGAELGLETMGLLMGKLMKNTQNLIICPDGDDKLKHRKNCETALFNVWIVENVF